MCRSCSATRSVSSRPGQPAIAEARRERGQGASPAAPVAQQHKGNPWSQEQLLVVIAQGSVTPTVRPAVSTLGKVAANFVGGAGQVHVSAVAVGSPTVLTRRAQRCRPPACQKTW